MENSFKGIIIEESLKDKKILDDFETISLKTTNDENSADRWHLYSVRGSKEIIHNLADFISGPKWYAHFWNNKEIIVVFQNKIFEFKKEKFQKEKQAAIEYGKKLGIPAEQLDFPLED